MSDYEIHMKELEKIATKVATLVRDLTDNPRIGIAGCFAAGIFWAERCQMDRNTMQQLFNAFYDKYTISLDDDETHH